MCFEMPPTIDCIELLEAASNGDWPWRLAIAVPTAEARDDPGGPCEAAGGMGVLLAQSFAFEGGAKGGEGLDRRRCEGGGGGQAIAAITLLDELDGDGCGFDGGGGELEEAIGAGDLAFLQVEAVGFHDAVNLLDGPACFVPGDQTPRIGGAGHVVSGQQAPVDRLGARGPVRSPHPGQPPAPPAWLGSGRFRGPAAARKP